MVKEARKRSCLDTSGRPYLSPSVPGKSGTRNKLTPAEYRYLAATGFPVPGQALVAGKYDFRTTLSTKTTIEAVAAQFNGSVCCVGKLLQRPLTSSSLPPLLLRGGPALCLDASNHVGALVDPLPGGRSGTPP